MGGISKKVQLTIDEDSFKQADKAYAKGDSEDFGAPLPSDEMTTIEDLFGGVEFVRGYPFFAMDWVKDGIFTDALEHNILEKVENHASLDSQSQLTKSRGRPERKTVGDLTIEQCFFEYTKEEMQEDCTWRCSGCKKDQIPQKKIDFLAGYLPDVMIVLLKRFAHRNLALFRGSGTYGHSQKIDLRVDFPLEG